MNTAFQNKRIVILAQVWPESRSSAAGKRMLQLIETFQSWDMEIFLSSTANKSEFSDDLSPFNVKEFEFWLNDSRTDQILKDLDPDIVLFDRFMVEEQFGWKVQEQCPRAMTVLDTEDLHFLRYARAQMFKDNATDLQSYLFTDRTKRELASILRCDLSLLISDFEYDLLINTFEVKKSLLFVLPFLEAPLPTQEMDSWLTYEQRQDLVFIGNFIHEPNWQTVLYIKKHLWPLLRKQLPGVKMHIYGAYPSQKVWDLHNASQGFLVHGRAQDALGVIAKARIMLAPIVFGAGIKGKFIDAIRVGTPSISSEIGAESMGDQTIWPGFIANTPEDYVQKTLELYTNKELWLEKQHKGKDIIEKLYNKTKHASNLYNCLEKIFKNLEKHRQEHFLAQVFKHHSALSSKYMGLWIEAKNALK
ncbi:glycosyltransferase [Myroides sp. LJL116]